ncbi:DNA primase [Candidatus Njordibacter sp. Uisw_039]|uniref:DNA primase n=1 Tax=Candidatus Njordibacter sp. Uisw_039 TaxID=3230972 RepID=UPI003D3F7CA0
MASRIPQSFIDDLLDRTDIVDLVDGHVKLKKTGRNYSACCPFHKEKTPSFSVAPDKQFYYCFGCGAGGNAIGFLMQLENLNFPEAVEELAGKAGLTVPKDDNVTSKAASAASQAKTQARNQAYDLLNRASQYYQSQLRRHPDRQKAVTYLKGRGLNGQIAQRFGVGYAPIGWQNLMQELAPKPELEQPLIDSGMVVEKEENKRRYDRFRDRIMFPIKDYKGRIIAFGGRVLGDEKPKYLNSPETVVFHKQKELYGLYEARQHERSLKRIMVVEGYMDVVALAQHNINYAVATLGTSTSSFHLERIFKLVSEVVFCFDGDAAGLKAADRAMHTCLPFMEDGRQARFLLLPDGEDPDSLVRQEGNDKLTARITDATPLSDFLFQRLGKDLDPHNLEHRAKLATDASPLIAIIPKGIMRSMMQARLSKITGLDKDTLAELSALKAPTPLPAAQTLAISHTKTPTSVASETTQATAHNSTHEYADYHMADANPELIEDTHHRHNETHYTASSEDHSLSAKQHFSATLPKVQNPAHAAIRIILRHPETVEHINEIPSHLAELKMQDAGVLTQLLSTVQTMRKALKRWPNPAELHIECSTWDAWPMLRQLAAMESLLPQGNYPQQLEEAISRLLGHHFEERFNQLMHLASQPNADANTKKQLKELLKEKEELQNRLKSRQ